MVTTKRQLAVQRFTAAHELGHAILGHKASLDKEDILTRAPFQLSGSFDSREIQANAFATELLTPQWLIVHHMTRQGWTRDSLADPFNVYQLALRMGSSYTATCYALKDSRAIDTETCDMLQQIKPRDLKQQLAHPHRAENWYGDVWMITERDNGLVLEGSRSDVVVVKVQEHSNSGYLWSFGELVDAGLAIRIDKRIALDNEHVGGSVIRNVIAEAERDIVEHIKLSEKRPWLPCEKSLNSIQLDIKLFGPMTAGWHPAQREEALLKVA